MTDYEKFIHHDRSLVCHKCGASHINLAPKINYLKNERYMKCYKCGEEWEHILWKGGESNQYELNNL